MLLHSNRKIFKYLTLVFIASFLMNAQASVACAMMHNMSEQKVECCCGVSHRSTVPTDLANEQATSVLTNDQHEQGPSCDDPQPGCCILEMSVGINDPPSSDELLTLSSSKVEQHKIFKQLDDYSTVFEVVFFEAQVVYVKDQISAFHEPFLKLHTQPLYKTTERYRI